MTAEAALQVHYLPLGAQAAAPWDGVLGFATFDGDAPNGESDSPAPAEVPSAAVRTAVLASVADRAADAADPGSGSDSDAVTAVREVWYTGQELESGRRSHLRYRRSEGILFGCISLPETAGLHAATSAAYREVFAAIDELGYPYLLRVWNYLPQINLHTQGTERYWQFNSARRAALVAAGREAEGRVPAACALGSAGGSPLVIYFLAARRAPTLIENPRQISAYDYPPQYGPKPAFSRASLFGDPGAGILFISGTASIVGHETVHVGDVAAQTRESMANIQALLDEANRVSQAPRFSAERLAYKVYVRHGTDLPLVRSQLHAALGSRAQALYLQADICRPDLLVEIEAIGRDAACE